MSSNVRPAAKAESKNQSLDDAKEHLSQAAQGARVVAERKVESLKNTLEAKSSDLKNSFEEKSSQLEARITERPIASIAAAAAAGFVFSYLFRRRS